MKKYVLKIFGQFLNGVGTKRITLTNDQTDAKQFDDLISLNSVKRILSDKFNLSQDNFLTVEL